MRMKLASGMWLSVEDDRLHLNSVVKVTLFLLTFDWKISDPEMLLCSNYVLMMNTVFKQALCVVL